VIRPDLTHTHTHTPNSLFCARVFTRSQAWPHGASIQNRNEDCPLHYAAAYATSADALKLLVDAAPASVLLLNGNGQSPIGKAKANDAPEEIIQMLEKAGEEWTQKALEDGWGDFS